VDIVAENSEAKLASLVGRACGRRKSPQLAPRVEIPEDQIAELATGQSPVAVGQEGRAADQIVVTHHSADLGPEIEIPEDHYSVGMPRQRAMPEGRTCDAQNRAWRLQAADPLTGTEIPEPQRSVVTTRQDGIAAGCRQRSNRTFM